MDNGYKKILFTIVSLVAIIGYGYFVYAAAPNGGYTPGSTLDPDCAPGDTDCIVALSGGGSVTADNGLTATGGNVSLGGTLTGDTTVDQSGFDFSIMNGDVGYQSSSDILGLGQPGIGMTYQDGNMKSMVGLLGNISPVMSLEGDFGPNHISRIISLGEPNGMEIEVSRNTRKTNFSIDSGSAVLSAIDTNASQNSNIEISYNNGVKFSFDGNSSSYVFPRTGGTAGQVLTTNGNGQLSWETPSGGGGGSGSPAGSNGQVQYNNGGVFGADSLFTRDTSTFNTYIGKNIDTPIYQYTVDLGDRISDHAYNGSFVVGETVVGQTSGATAVVQRADSPVLVTSVTGTFQDGETVVGQTSGADLLYSNGGPVQPGDTVLIIEIGSNSLRGIGTVVSTNFTQAIIETTAVVQADDYMGTIVGNTFANTSNSVANIVSQTQVGTQNGSTNVAIGNTVNLLGGTLTGIGSVMSSSSAPGHEAQVFVGSNQTMGLDDTFILSSTNNTTNLGSVIFGGTTILGSSVIQISTGDINGGGSGQSSGIDLNTDNSSSSIVFNVGTNGQIGNLQQNGSVAFGYNALASGNNAFAFGNNAQAQGKYSVSIGGSSTAYNDDSFAIGPYTQAYQQSSFAIGTQLSSYSAYETVIGVSNTAYTPFDAGSWNNIDRLFVIGNGQNGSEHNAYTMWKDGSFAYNDSNFQNDINDGSEQNMFYFNYGNHDGLGSIQSKSAIRLGSVRGGEADINGFNVGDRSVAIGFAEAGFFGANGPIASGFHSVAIGSNASAAGNYSLALGHQSYALGNDSFSFGIQSTAAGLGSVVFGNSANANGDQGQSFGLGSSSYSYAETSLGTYNSTYTPLDVSAFNSADRLLVIGNGTGGGSKSNAYTMWKDGSFAYNDDNFQNDNVGIEQNMFYFNYGNHDGLGGVNAKRAIRLGSVSNNEWDIGSANIGNRSIAIGFDGKFGGLIASGPSSIAIGADSMASGTSSIVLGVSSTASGTSAVTLGSTNTASGDFSTAMGIGSIASGNNSTAMGTTSIASGFASGVLGGVGSIASGDYSTVFGLGITARSAGEIAIGIQNTDYVPTSISQVYNSDRLFVVGNGDGDFSDAFTILKSGQTGIGIDNFEANTNGSMFQVGDGSTNVIGYVDSGTGNWVAVSDERKKDNITDLSYGLEQVLQLRPTSFNYKRNGEHTIGFIAQQVLPIIPESVYGSESEGYGMSYATLTPVLVKAIQEMNLKITDIDNTETPNTWRDALIGWFGSAANGIRKLFVGEVHTDTLCIGQTCVTESQLQQLLQNNQQVIIPSSSGNPPSDSNPTTTSDDTIVPSDTTEPIIDSNPVSDTGSNTTASGDTPTE